MRIVVTRSSLDSECVHQPLLSAKNSNRLRQPNLWGAYVLHVSTYWQSTYHQHTQYVAADSKGCAEMILAIYTHRKYVHTDKVHVITHAVCGGWSQGARGDDCGCREAEARIRVQSWRGMHDLWLSCLYVCIHHVCVHMQIYPLVRYAYVCTCAYIHAQRVEQICSYLQPWFVILHHLFNECVCMRTRVLCHVRTRIHVYMWPWFEKYLPHMFILYVHACMRTH